MNNCYINNNDVPNIILQYKKNNDWEKILNYYNINFFIEKLKEDISVAELNEILFAAGHYVYVLNDSANDKESFKKVLLVYFWTQDNTKTAVKTHPECLALLKSYAYINYELSTGLGYAFSKKVKITGLNDNNVNKKLAMLKINAYNEAKITYEKILTKDEKDIKSHYRYARLLKKEYDANGYKFSADVKHENGLLINSHFQQVRRLYESLRSEADKKKYHPYYIKALYDYASYTFDMELPSLSLKMLHNAMKYDKTFYISQKGNNGIECKIEKLKNARKYLEISAIKANCPLKELTEKEINQIATIENPVILPMYFYYTYAKMCYIVSIFYTSTKKGFAKYYKEHKQESIKKANEYLSLAKKYCQYAIDIRMQRKHAGFSDAGGIFPEISLLGKIYTIMCFRTGSGEDISILYKNNLKNEEVKFYHAICLYYLDPIKNHDKSIQLLRELKSASYKTKARREIEYINNPKSE